ncbi:MAG: hypothetical protein ACRD0Q_11040, partial [Acidimicrobiales bacterium]
MRPRVTTVLVAVLAAGLFGSGVVVASVRLDDAGTVTTARPAGHLEATGRAAGSLPAKDPPAGESPPAAGPSMALPAPYLGNRTPGSVVVPFSAGRTSWAATSNGIDIRVTVSPDGRRAGSAVTFVVEASSPGQKCCRLTMQFGDDAMGYWPVPEPSAAERGPGASGACGSHDPASDSVRAELPHAYNRAGRWTFRVTAFSGGECEAGVYGALEGSLQIAAGGPTTGQGPTLARVRPASIYPYESRVMTLGAEAADDDGHVARLIVDWGDGSAEETYANPRPCRTTASGWPSGSYVILPLWMGVGPVTHRYADDNRYRVTVTVVSTDCAGGTEQSASAGVWFPGPPPPPIEEVMATAPVPTGPPPPFPTMPATLPPPTWTPPPPVMPASAP